MFPRRRCPLSILVRGSSLGAVVATILGCSAASGPPVVAGRKPEAEPVLVGATTSGDLADAERHRTIRPVPDVVSKPRPVRLSPLVPGVPEGVVDPEPTGAVEPQVVDVPTEPVALAAVPAERHAEPAAAAVPAEAEIRDMLRSYLRAFNQHDAATLAAHWSPAGESVDLDTGDVTTGREAVREVFAALFAEDDAASIDIDVTSIRPIRADVAVVDGVTRVAFAEGLPAGSRFSAVVVRDGGRWLLESVRQATQPQADPAPRPLEELAWLVGAWEDTGAGVTAGTQCFWSAGRAFLVRTHRVRPDAGVEPAVQAAAPGLLTPGDASPRELTEIIGWDADRGAIRSWLFTSSGRFAEATWTRRATDGAWTIRVEGRGRDEGATCTCTLAVDNADGLSMTCDSDSLAGLLPPACGFVRSARLGAPAAK